MNFGDKIRTFWVLYKNDSTLWSIQSKSSTIITSILVPSLSFLLYYWKITQIDASIILVPALVVANAFCPVIYYVNGYRKHIHISQVKTWEKKRTKRIDHEKPIIKSTFTYLSFLVHFRPHPDSWEIRIWTPIDIVMRKVASGFAPHWQVRQPDDENFIVSCNIAQSYGAFSIGVKAKHHSTTNISNFIKFFCKTNLNPQESEIRAERFFYEM